MQKRKILDQNSNKFDFLCLFWDIAGEIYLLVLVCCVPLHLLVGRETRRNDIERSIELLLCWDVHSLSSTTKQAQNPLITMEQRPRTMDKSNHRTQMSSVQS